MLTILTFLVVVVGISWATERIERRITTLQATADRIESEQEIQHSIDRKFIGVNLIEGQVLPLLKGDKPTVDCGSF